MASGSCWFSFLLKSLGPWYLRFRYIFPKKSHQESPFECLMSEIRTILSHWCSSHSVYTVTFGWIWSWAHVVFCLWNDGTILGISLAASFCHFQVCELWPYNQIYPMINSIPLNPIKLLVRSTFSQELLSLLQPEII
jgi:hypothetical protein